MRLTIIRNFCVLFIICVFFISIIAYINYKYEENFKHSILPHKNIINSTSSSSFSNVKNDHKIQDLPAKNYDVSHHEYPIIMSSPLPPQDSETYKAIQSMDILDVKDDRVYVMIHDLLSQVEHELTIPYLSIENEMTEKLHEPPEQYTSKYFTHSRSLTPGYTTIPSFSCYRDVDGSYATMEYLANTYPTLVEIINIGPSYLKSIGKGGDEMKVLKLTNRDKSISKAPLFVICAIHPREYAPSEACARFAEDMLDQYGKDSDKTWILDYTEIHIVLQANPDSRRDEESLPARFRRKNMNNGSCLCQWSLRGVDLNRNFPHAAWGTSSAGLLGKCGETYYGESPGSEKETQAIVNYMLSVMPPGTNSIDPNTGAYSIGSKGVLMDMHSYGQVFFYPYAYSFSAVNPNRVDYGAFVKKMASFTSPLYNSENPFYITSGDTTDYAYDAMGIASFTMELGTSFHQSCSYFESNVNKNALDVLLYAARVANAPYNFPKGPDVVWMTLSPTYLTANDVLYVQVQVSDKFRSLNYLTGEDRITSIKLYIDTHPYETDAIPNVDMTTGFTSYEERKVLDLSLRGFDPGKHILYIQTSDTRGDGPISSAFFDISS